MEGIDPSEGQLAYARKRLSIDQANFSKGDAMALPFANHSFDAAVMALVLVFVSDPRKAVEEMVRVVKPGGRVATYMWDMLGDGFPLEPIILEMHNMGLAPPRPPRMEASSMGRCEICGREPVSTKWKCGKSGCTAFSRISTISGWPSRQRRPSAPRSLR